MMAKSSDLRKAEEWLKKIAVSVDSTADPRTWLKGFYLVLQGTVDRDSATTRIGFQVMRTVQASAEAMAELVSRRTEIIRVAADLGIHDAKLFLKQVEKELAQHPPPRSIAKSANIE